MRLHLRAPVKVGKRLKERLQPLVESYEDEDWGESWDAVCHQYCASSHHFIFRVQRILIFPGAFREVDSIFGSETHGKGTLEVEDTSVQTTGDQEL